MNNKLNNMINEFFEKNKVKDEKEMNKKLQEFITKYNNGEIEYENTPLDDALEMLENAKNANSRKEAMRIAHKAYEQYPECFEALLFEIALETNHSKKRRLLRDGLELEEERLKKEHYFDKENIGHFYGIFETRPYIKGLNFKAELLFREKEYEKGIDVCKEILRLNPNDNLGARFMLMGVYAITKNEKELLKLYKRYECETLTELFPLFLLYYKLNDMDKAKEYLEKINKNNPYFIKFCKGELKLNEYALKDYYSIGDESEAVMYFTEFDYIVSELPNLKEIVLELLNNKSEQL